MIDYGAVVNIMSADVMKEIGLKVDLLMENVMLWIIDLF